MENEALIIQRLSRLEETVNTIASKIDKVLKPPRRISDPVVNPYDDTMMGRNWVRMYSKKKGENFLYQTKTQKIIWESESLKTATEGWEKISFCDEFGELQSFFLNTSSGEVSSREPPNLTQEKHASLEFDPGYFDPSAKPSSKQSQSTGQTRKSFVKPSQQSMKRRSKSIASIHPDREELIGHERTLNDKGSKSDVTTTDAPIEKRHYCMFDPFSSRRTGWDLCIILPCLLYLTVMMPYRLCFVDVAQGTMLMMETTMDMFFVLDIFINFRTGYFVPEEGIVEYNPKKVAKEYIRSWFALDLISGIPFGLFDMAFFNSLSFIKILKGSRMFKAVKLLRFIKLTRLFKLGKVIAGCSPGNMDWLEDKLNDVTTRSALSMCRIMAVISLVVHFMACLWVLIGRTEDIHGRPNWLRNDIYTGDGQGFTHRDTMGGPKVKAIYISAYYYCYTTITSVGYGDIHPYNDNERLFCLALEALGGFMYAIIIAALTSIANITDTNKRAVGERLDMVASYVKIKRFPEQLGRRVRRYFRHYFESKTAIDEEQILSDLPTGLRDEVSTFLVSDLMSNVTLFKDLGPVSWSRILPLLRPCRFEAGDLICSQGEPCTEGFILLEGECRAVTVVDPGLFSEAMIGLRGKPSPAMKNNLLVSTTPPRSFNDPSKSSAASKAASSAKAAKDFATKLISRVSSDGGSTESSLDQPPPNAPPPSTSSSFSRSHSFDAISPLPTTPKPTKGAKVSGNTHFRDLHPGSMVNVLALLEIWPTCLETVMCSTETETYTINAKQFLSIFQQNDSHFKEITEKCILTSFHMYKANSNAGGSSMSSPYGIPLYMFEQAEIEFRTEAYLAWKDAKRERFVEALKQYEAEVAQIASMNRANALRTVVKMIRSRRDSRAIVHSGKMKTKSHHKPALGDVGEAGSVDFTNGSASIAEESKEDEEESYDSQSIGSNNFRSLNGSPLRSDSPGEFPRTPSPADTIELIETNNNIKTMQPVAPLCELAQPGRIKLPSLE